MKRITLMGLGWIFLMLGVAGLFLPMMPGIPLLLVSLVILSQEYAWARHLHVRLRTRFPRVAKNCERIWQNIRVRVLHWPCPRGALLRFGTLLHASRKEAIQREERQ
jgi:hypothetical protein